MMVTISENHRINQVSTSATLVMSFDPMILINGMDPNVKQK